MYMYMHRYEHCLTFEPLGVDLFDEASVNISRNKLWLSNNVSQDRDVVVDPWKGEGRGGKVYPDIRLLNCVVEGKV